MEPLDFMQTYTGRCPEPFDLKSKDVDMADISHSLALKCRFGGHCKDFYSVAEHCVRVSLLLQRQYPHDAKMAMLGLLHDASETYLPDAIAPIKRHFKVWLEHENQDVKFKTMEQRIMIAILRALNLRDWCIDLEHDRKEAKAIKHADFVLLATEARDLMSKPDRPWMELPAPEPVRLRPWSWKHARSAFLSRYFDLSGSLSSGTTQWKDPAVWDEAAAKGQYPTGWERMTA